MLSPSTVARVQRALPFWVSLLLVPVGVMGALVGGGATILLPIMTWLLFSLLDALVGEDTENADPATGEDQIAWYRAITLIWVPVQFCFLYWMIWYVSGAEHLATLEKIALFFGVGAVTGAIGINYSHELMHQKDRGERFLGDALLSMVLYSHFRSEHLLVHHRHVATPQDPATARFDEGFYQFFPRVLKSSLYSSFLTERALLLRRGQSGWSIRNPFWRYGVMQVFMLSLALLVGGWVGLGLFLWQAIVAIWQLELVNYVEHYGLTRQRLDSGRYEHVKPRHSWNSAQRVSNWLLINLQRHSDHHYKPDRRFPLLQTYDAKDAPQLPYGYPVMTIAAMIPPLWRRIMNPRVEAWRAQHYPEITDWAAQSEIV